MGFLLRQTAQSVFPIKEVYSMHRLLIVSLLQAYKFPTLILSCFTVTAPSTSSTVGGMSLVLIRRSKFIILSLGYIGGDHIKWKVMDSLTSRIVRPSTVMFSTTEGGIGGTACKQSLTPFRSRLLQKNSVAMTGATCNR